ncbi:MULTISPECIES: 4Fe-4S single cluster domain-containing protein [unclassified Pseudoalteromonas]|uniref:4Fe-4S single cluster domain-containing protein n=1 Tax=unclassified Pseudoalteromonas TaxID=194690 RepID=UPI0015FA5CFB|nr:MULTISPECIES: 4Fe-4S single cluster domain-containing protein [unclassified Pseudoalteromonas]MBB1354243.1 4Fe-4S cluster-binding domain-containing protein [Pseudoalteromonas sp. SR45-5]MBB1403804.1 4Fe-4S cluster-binding domain-containing protein [Pseudoalteromonas sp. SG45-1]
MTNIDEGNSFFNLAHIEAHTHIYGPGSRFTIWLQGCSLGCKGCWNTQMWPHRERTLVHREKLYQQILDTPEISGITFLGGEPLEQADNTLWLIKMIKDNTSLTNVVYTGFEQRELELKGYWSALCENSDLIISGRYQHSLRNPYLRLRGSTNQKLVYPHGSRLMEESDGGNEIEIVIDSLGSITTLGYPD